MIDLNLLLSSLCVSFVLIVLFAWLAPILAKEGQEEFNRLLDKYRELGLDYLTQEIVIKDKKYPQEAEKLRRVLECLRYESEAVIRDDVKNEV